jgi:hypothetical protein
VKRTYFSLIALAGLFMFGCATGIPMKVTKPAEFDLGDVKTIAVLPFGFPSLGQDGDLDPRQAALERLKIADSGEWNPIERDSAKEAEAVFTTLMKDTGRFSVLTTEDLMGGADPSDPSASINADAIAAGSIVTLASIVTDRSYKGTSGKTVHSYTDAVYVELRIDLIQAGTNEVLATKTFSGRAKAEKLSDRPSVDAKTREIASAMIRGWKDGMRRALGPYTVTEARRLAEDDKKDPRMEEATKLVEAGSYRKAFDLYLDIYGATKDFAAGFNAAIMKEVLGDPEGAYADMEALAKASTNSKARKEADRIKASLPGAEESGAE